jgi:hypothetical protein
MEAIYEEMTQMAQKTPATSEGKAWLNIVSLP